MIISKSFRGSARVLGRSKLRLGPQCSSFKKYSTANIRIDITKPQSCSRLLLRCSSTPWQCQSRSPRISASAVISARLNSTASDVPPLPNVAESSATFEPAFPLMSEDGFDIATDDNANILEHIGYLKELGLDYGWGPTAFVEWLLEHIHIYAGTPWWASIALAALTIRLALLKPYLNAADVYARMASVRPLLKPITDKMTEAATKRDQVLVQQCRMEMQRINRRAGIQTWKVAIPLVQVFIGFGTFRLMRGMGNLPVPGLETGGFLWLHDLTASDPYYIMPLATVFMFFSAMKLGGETGVSMMKPRMRIVLTYFLPTLTGIFMISWPGALQISFFFNSVLSTLQASFLRNNSFRDWIGVTRNPEPTPTTGGASPSPYSGTLTTAAAYKKPVAPNPTSHVMKAKGFVGGAISDFKGATSEAMKSANSYMGADMGTGEKSAARKAAEAEELRLYEERKKRAEEKRKEKAEEAIQKREFEQESKLARWQERKLAQSRKRGR